MGEGKGEGENGLLTLRILTSRGGGGRLSGDVALTVPLASTATAAAAPGSVVVVDDISVDTCAAIPTTIAASTATAATENTNNSLPQYLSEKKLSVIRKTS